MAPQQCNLDIGIVSRSYYLFSFAYCVVGSMKRKPSFFLVLCRENISSQTLVSVGMGIKLISKRVLPFGENKLQSGPIHLKTFCDSQQTYFD